MSADKTFSQKPADVTRVWHVVDASQAPLGRVATEVATLLTGKGKPTFTPHVDGGDYVVVINAANLIVTGDKAGKKTYYKYSGFPGGLKETKLDKQDPIKTVELAVRGMIPANKLRAGRMARLKVYTDDQHNHHAQKPVNYTLKGVK